MTTDSIIHLRVPAALKARWVRESRAAGMRLTDWIVQRVEAASGLPKGFFTGQPEDALASLITAWYDRHIAAGGARDPVADDLIAEVRAEDAEGQPYSHAPGRA